MNRRWGYLQLSTGSIVAHYVSVFPSELPRLGRRVPSLVPPLCLLRYVRLPHRGRVGTVSILLRVGFDNFSRGKRQAPQLADTDQCRAPEP